MKFKVQKFDPAVDAAPYYIEGEIAYTEKMTLLEAVNRFNETVGYIAFDYSCHGRQCGRCAVMLDGSPALMCCTPLTDGDHVVEPLKGQQVVRDLIVDKTEYHDRLSRQYVRKRIEPITEEEYLNNAGTDNTNSQTLWNLTRCMRCGMCDAVCPVKNSNSEYAGPSTMVAIAMRHFDPYDQGDRVMDAVSAGLYHCILCGKCDEVCQRYEIDHVGVWQLLRSEAEKRGIKPSYAE